MHFIPVFAAVPLALSAGGEFKVASLGVVGNRVKEVFPVLKGNTGYLNFSSGVLRTGYNGHKKCRGEQRGDKCMFQVHVSFL